MKNISKIDDLLIRACKSTNPEQRIKTTLKRFYLIGEHDIDQAIKTLAEIIDEYIPMTVNELFIKLENKRYDSHLIDNYKKFWIVVDKIRYADVKNFPGISVPRRFK